MRYMEIDFHPMEITVWVKDDQLKKSWVKTYNIYRDGKYKTAIDVLEIAYDLAQEYGVYYIRILERVGGFAYEWMKSHTARREGPQVERYLYYDFADAIISRGE